MTPRAALVRIPDTPRGLLEAAAVMSRLRAQCEARGEVWPTLEAECLAREGWARVPDDD